MRDQVRASAALACQAWTPARGYLRTTRPGSMTWCRSSAGSRRVHRARLIFGATVRSSFLAGRLGRGSSSSGNISSALTMPYRRTAMIHDTVCLAIPMLPHARPGWGRRCRRLLTGQPARPRRRGAVSPSGFSLWQARVSGHHAVGVIPPTTERPTGHPLGGQERTAVAVRVDGPAVTVRRVPAGRSA